VSSSLVEAVGHFLDLERGVVPGQEEIDLAAAVDGTGVAVMKIDCKPAVEGDLPGGWLMPAEGRDL